MALAVLGPLLLGGFFVWRSAALTGGHFYYYMDDAYIHMGVAKNLLQNGSIGLNETTFTSITSSPLYTFLIAGFLVVFNYSDQVLLYMAMATWAALAVSMGLAFKRYGYSSLAYWVYIGSLVVCVPVSLAFLSGMEHLLHLWLASLVLIHWVGASTNSTPKQTPWWLWLLVSLAVLARIETLLLGLTIAGVDMLTGKWRRGLGLTLATLLPPLAFFAWVHANGGNFIPNTMVVKSNLDTSGLGGLLGSIWHKVEIKLFLIDRFWQFAVAICGLVYVGWVWVKTKSLYTLRAWLACLGCLVPSLLLTDYELTNRYDIWLNGIVLLVFALSVSDIKLPRLQGFGTLAMLVLPWLYYGLSAYAFIPRSGVLRLGLLALLVVYLLYFALKNPEKIPKGLLPIVPSLVLVFVLCTTRFLVNAADSFKYGYNIYNQQYAYGRFLHAAYNGQTIVLNDIGTASFLTDCPIVDCIGLATTPLISVGKHLYATNQVSNLSLIDSVATARGASIAIVNPTWFKKDIPKRWVLAGTWHCQNTGQILASSDINFYAFDSAAARVLTQKLAAFVSEVPATTRFLPPGK